MRKSLVLATLVVLACTASAFAGVPDPTRSGCGLSAKPLACQWRFRADGGLDRLTLKVTIRDTFGAAVASCSTRCNLAAPSLATTKSCGPLSPLYGGSRKVGVTDAGGVVNFVYRCIGGRGTVDLRVTTFCATSIGICSTTITFTNPDLNGSVESANSPGSTTIIDLGIWAGCFAPSPYCVPSDLDCNGTVNVVDLGLVAGGLAKGCISCP